MIYKKFVPLAIITSLVSGCIFMKSNKDSLPDKVEFNEHIRPILSDKCFHCHGNDAETAEADLLLNSFSGATKN